MKAVKQNKSKFLVLVPHGEVRSVLRKYNDFMIQAGTAGGYGFPLAAPIAEISRDFSADELKLFAHVLRKELGKEKITADETAIVPIPIIGDNYEKFDNALFGSRLNLNISDKIFGDGIQKVKNIFSPIVIGTFLIPAKTCESVCAFEQIQPPRLSFRAAAVANMYWQPVKIKGEIGYKWKIGKLVWLPNRTV